MRGPYVVNFKSQSNQVRMNLVPQTIYNNGHLNGNGNNNALHLQNHFPQGEVEHQYYNDDDFRKDLNEDKSQKLKDNISRLKILLTDSINKRVQWLKPVRYGN